MPHNETDEEIISLYKEGNTEAFKFLIERYTPPLFNFTARLAGRENAADLLQEVFIKVWKHVGNFDAAKASFKTWIFTIARNTITDFFRKKKYMNFSDLESPDEDLSFSEKIPSEELLPIEMLQKLEDREILDKALEELRPHYREVLVLHYQEEMTFDEIGKILDKPLNTVRSDHRRAILELRKILS